MQTTKVAIVGASGYSGQELVRLLLRHPRVAITCFTSRQYAGKPVTDVFPMSAGGLTPPSSNRKWPRSSPAARRRRSSRCPTGWPPNTPGRCWSRGSRCSIQRGFPAESAAVYQEFYEHEHPAPALLARAVYGLPEIRRDAIRQADLIACPGCYPTSIILGCAPALKRGLARPHGIVAASLSGVTGAGRKVAEEFIFPECNESVRAYGLPKHRHLSEIEQELSLLAGGRSEDQFCAAPGPDQSRHRQHDLPRSGQDRDDRRRARAVPEFTGARRRAGQPGVAGHEERG